MLGANRVAKEGLSRHLQYRVARLPHFRALTGMREQRRALWHRGCAGNRLIQKGSY
jgi:hypothetical protein